MLALTRRRGEIIDITDSAGVKFEVHVLRVTSHGESMPPGVQVVLGIEAPQSIRANRREVSNRIARELAQGH